MLRKSSSVTTYETPWQPLSNARAVTADTEVAFVAAAPVTRCVAVYLPAHPSHTVRPGFPQQAQMSRLLTVQYHRNSPGWSSDATELPAADVFLNNKQKDGLESGRS